MAVPKKKASRARHRRRLAANTRIEPPARSTCPHCHHVKVPHTVCPNCGWYKGRMVVEVD